VAQAAPAPAQAAPEKLSARAILDLAVAARRRRGVAEPAHLDHGRARDLLWRRAGATRRRGLPDVARLQSDRTSSHGADGLVRIRAISGGKRLFEVGYDGTTTWNDKGIVPQAEADAYWASAFGFGIIRQASRPGFVLSRVPDDQFAGHPIYKLRLVDPKGGETLFGIDKTSHAIRTMEFATPKGGTCGPMTTSSCWTIRAGSRPAP
jgi:hypothetical protein